MGMVYSGPLHLYKIGRRLYDMMHEYVAFRSFGHLVSLDGRKWVATVSARRMHSSFA